MKTVFLILCLLMSFPVMAKDAPSLSEKSNDLPLITLDNPRGMLSTADVEKWLEGLSGVRSGFMQTNPDGSILHGTFSMERPGKVRFEYDGDAPVLIVSDGKTLNMVDYDLGEVTRWPVKDTPLAILLDRDFSFGDFATIETIEAGDLANLFRVVAHDPKRPEMGKISLVFEDLGGGKTPDLELRAWQVVDPQGYLTTVNLMGLEKVSAFPKSHWAYEDPRGNRFTRRRR